MWGIRESHVRILIAVFFFCLFRRWSRWTSCCRAWTRPKTESSGSASTRLERSGRWTSRSKLQPVRGGRTLFSQSTQTCTHWPRGSVPPGLMLDHISLGFGIISSPLVHVWQTVRSVPLWLQTAEIDHSVLGFCENCKGWVKMSRWYQVWWLIVFRHATRCPARTTWHTKNKVQSEFGASGRSGEANNCEAPTGHQWTFHIL